MNGNPRDFDRHFAGEGWDEAALAICGELRVKTRHIERASSSDHVVFLVNDDLVLKIFRPSRNCFERERKALEFASGRLPFRTPEIAASGKFDGLDYMLMTRVPGLSMSRPEFLGLPEDEGILILEELADGLRQMHDIEPSFFTDDWPDFIENRAETFIERQIEHGVDPKVVEALPAFIENNLPTVPRRPTVFLHGDVHFGNLRFERSGGRMRISGLFDFADSRRGFHEYDLLAVGVLMIQGQRELQRRFLQAYGYAAEDLTEEMRNRLMMLTVLYETSDLRRYATRLAPEAVTFPLDELKRAIWNFV